MMSVEKSKIKIFKNNLSYSFNKGPLNLNNNCIKVVNFKISSFINLDWAKDQETLINFWICFST
jgi:hypothetical protein